LRRVRAGATLLVVAWCLAALTPADLGSDTYGYFAYLHSIAFDHDLDFANEYATFNVAEPGLTETGASYSPYAVGPALAWFPFYFLTHLAMLVAQSVGALPWPADGLSLPYRYAARWGTAFYFLVALLFLYRELVRHFPSSAARLGLAGAVMATPAAYYASLGLTMSHSLSAAWACLCFVSAQAALVSGRRRDWVLCGGALGVLMMTRWQAVVFACFPLLVTLARGLRGQRELKGPLLGLAAGLAAFSPQMLMWKLQYGTWIWLPRYQGAAAARSWFDPSQAHWQDVLWSANKGLLIWTPMTILCLVGLILALRRSALVVLGGGLIFVFTLFLVSSSVDWHGSDAFGSRKFDLMLPFFAWGLSRLAEELLRRPSLTVSLVFSAFILWNIGLIRLKDAGELEPPTPIGRLAAAQISQASDDTQRILVRLLGRRGAETWYRVFFGDYIYSTSNSSGWLWLSDPRSPYLSLGFSEAVNNQGAPRYRWAAPFSCVKFPIERSHDPLPTSVRLRNAPGIPEQTFQIHLNGTTVAARESLPEWSEPSFLLPPETQITGMNRLCFTFSKSTEVDGELRSAAISVVRLP